MHNMYTTIFLLQNEPIDLLPYGTARTVITIHNRLIFMRCFAAPCGTRGSAPFHYPLDRNWFPVHTVRPRNHIDTRPKMVARSPPFIKSSLVANEPSIQANCKLHVAWCYKIQYPSPSNYHSPPSYSTTSALLPQQLVELNQAIPFIVKIVNACILGKPSESSVRIWHSFPGSLCDSRYMANLQIIFPPHDGLENSQSHRFSLVIEQCFRSSLHNCGCIAMESGSGELVAKAQTVRKHKVTIQGIGSQYSCCL
jgi:hypothetical protein